MARVIKIDKVSSFEIISGEVDLFSTFEKINNTFGFETRLNGECLLEGLYMKAREEYAKRRRKLQSIPNGLPDDLTELDDLVPSAHSFKTRRSKKSKESSKLGVHVYLINGVGDLSYDKLEEYRTLVSKESDIINKSAMIYVMRGMNDDARLFEEGTIDFPNVKFISDYTVLGVGHDINCLCIGGALSRHRQWLKSMGMYHDNEVPVFNRKELDDAFGKCNNINCLITGCPNTSLGKRVMMPSKWEKSDSDLKKSIKEVEKVMDNILNYLEYKGNNIFMWNVANTSTLSNISFNGKWEVVTMAFRGGGRAFPFGVYDKLMMKKRHAEEERMKIKAMKDSDGDATQPVATLDTTRLRDILRRHSGNREGISLRNLNLVTETTALGEDLFAQNITAPHFEARPLAAYETDGIQAERPTVDAQIWNPQF